jgi:hypothetical protein
VAERLGFLPTNQKLTRRLKIKKDTDPLASPFFHFSLVKSLPTADVQWKPKGKKKSNPPEIPCFLSSKPSGHPLSLFGLLQHETPRETERERVVDTLALILGMWNSDWYFGFDFGGWVVVDCGLNLVDFMEKFMGCVGLTENGVGKIFTW